MKPQCLRALTDGRCSYPHCMCPVITPSAERASKIEEQSVSPIVSVVGRVSPAIIAPDEPAMAKPSTVAQPLGAGSGEGRSRDDSRERPATSSVPSSARPPIPMLMFCPRCSKQHIDAPKGDWANPPHATHTCQHCGLLWRPSNENTAGVSGIKLLEAKHAERIAASFPLTATEAKVCPWWPSRWCVGSLQQAAPSATSPTKEEKL